MSAGILFGIGVGPGDPDLLTMKAIKTMQRVDTIIAPHTEKKDDSLALKIAAPYLRSDVEMSIKLFQW